MKEIAEELILFEKHIPGGWNWSHHLKKGTSVRLTDVEGGANASALFYNSADYTERYNMADSLKAQYTSYFTKGHALYSDMGRILLTIIGDTCGWHDTMTACSTPQTNQKKYGVKNYQEHRNNYHRDAFTSLLTEVAKYGMSLKDMHSLVNFFTKVNVNEAGELVYEPHSTAGAYIDLQAEMDTLVVLNTCPHPLDPNPVYAPKPLKITVWKSDCGMEDNPCYHLRDENKRGFMNTMNYLK